MIHSFLRTWKNGYYRLCRHRSDRLRLRCYRPLRWDGYCRKHTYEEWAREGYGL